MVQFLNQQHIQLQIIALKTYEIFGDIAIIHSHLTVNLTFKDGASSIASEGAIQDNVSEGKYLDVLRKQEDGSWKCLVHTWEQIN